MGIDCTKVEFPEEVPNRYKDEKLLGRIEAALKSDGFDCLYTTNFWPLAALAAHNIGIPYISWSYDSPPNLPTEQYMDFDTNYIFFFSRDDVNTYKAMGLDNVYHMPLAVNTDRWDRVSAGSRYRCDISLVGSLYRSTLPTLKTRMNEYQKAYVDAVVDNQRQIYGSYVVRQLITAEFTEGVCRQFKSIDTDSILPNQRQMVYSVASQVTYLDRMTLLKLLSARYNTHFYTDDINDNEKKILSDLHVHGTVDYISEMPQVFKGSKINLCPTFRGNCSGIPLRMLDVMGCRRFVLSSLQPEVEENFESGKDIVMYSSIEEAVDLSDYYLKHDEERKKISDNGYEIVKKRFNYPDQLSGMLRIAGLSSL
jgi:spore maturation protein CgeB